MQWIFHPWLIIKMDVVLVGSLEGGEQFDDICWLIWGWRAL